MDAEAAVRAGDGTAWRRRCSPPAPWWASALHRLPNRKFLATRLAHTRAALVPCGTRTGEELSRQNLEFVWRYYARLPQLLLPARRRDLRGTIDGDGQALDNALAAGRGLILVSAHLGDFEVASAWITQAGHEVVATVGDVDQRVRQMLFDRVRHACGVHLRRAEETTLAHLVGDLERGRIVLVMLDRRSRAATLDGTFLGHPAQLSLTPYALARRSGAPILTAATVTLARDRRVVLFGPLRCVAGSVLPRGPRCLTQELAMDVERFIRFAPEQWHVPTDLGQLPWMS